MTDSNIEKLADFFRSHPVWVDAASSVKDGASSAVTFSHVKGDWRLIRVGGESLLEPGTAVAPDFCFHLTPDSISAITNVEGGVGDFAIELLGQIADPDSGVELRVLAPFPKLLRRGYIQVLLKGGPKVLQFGASRGVRSLSDLRRLLKSVQFAGNTWQDDANQAHVVDEEGINHI